MSHSEEKPLNSPRKIELKNPSGNQQICLTKPQERVEIELEDLESGERSFSLEVVLEGAGAHCTITGKILTHQQEKKEWSVVQIFRGKSQTGHLKLRGVAQDHSHLTINGTGVLEHGSRQASVRVDEKILLFDQAVAKALPVLTVHTDQVESASHAAVIAPIEAEELLYLASRGLSPEHTQALIKKGFLGEE